jgi:hypothetical protein
LVFTGSGEGPGDDLVGVGCLLAVQAGHWAVHHAGLARL